VRGTISAYYALWDLILLRLERGGRREEAWFDSWEEQDFFSSPKYNTGSGAHPAPY